MQGQSDLLWLCEWLHISDLHTARDGLNTENASTNNNKGCVYTSGSTKNTGGWLDENKINNAMLSKNKKKKRERNKVYL